MLTEYHRQFDGSIRWRLRSDGIDVEQQGLQRTPGEPLTARQIWRDHRIPIQTWAARYGVAVELLIATCATESIPIHGQRDPNQVREEPGYRSDEATPGLVSVGLCHVTIREARDVLGYPIGRAWLKVPFNNFHAAAASIRAHAGVHGFDPVLVAAKYNAGRLEETGRNRWRLVTTQNHLDRFSNWLGDAIEVVRSGGGCERDFGWMIKAAIAEVL